MAWRTFEARLAMTRDSDLLQYTLRLGDNALVLGQRLGEWVGHAPALEEEMALANFALDYIGQARLFLSYAAELEQAGRDEDALAFRRDGMDFHNVLLVEQPNGDFGYTIVRQFLFDAFYLHQLEALTGSSDTRLAEIASRALREIRYHLRHCRQWLLRLGDGTEESRQRVQTALEDTWRFTGELFDADEVDTKIHARGIGPGLDGLRPLWEETVNAALAEATLERPAAQTMLTGGKQGRHTEHLGFLLAEMQFLPRAYPDARW
jgi:ring-1,2-phenylacetyl-CoA epoxidase subunit PaaC